jgi:signal peptidase I
MKLSKLLRLDRFIKNEAIREWIEAILFALIVAGFFRTWLYSPYRVPTGSMIHTIEVGDYLFADMHAYGFVIPFTDIKLFPSKVRRNDIIIFPSPDNPSIPYIKRVIAVEGDEVEIRGERIFINGQPERADPLFFDENMSPVPYSPFFFVRQTFTVPKGKVWPLGDNRRNSLDGRYWGFIEMGKVRARGLIVAWNHDPARSLLTGYRFNRIGTILN